MGKRRNRKSKAVTTTERQEIDLPSAPAGVPPDPLAALAPQCPSCRRHHSGFCL